MDKAVHVGITVVLILIGMFLIISNPADETLIIISMVLIAAGIINLTLRIHFPKKSEVELKVLEPEKLKPRRLKRTKRRRKR